MTANPAFLAYATANDPFGYMLDHANFGRMAALASGVARIDICIAVSEVVPRRRRDERWYRGLADGLELTGGFRVMDIVFKSNLGRDFSSWRTCIERFRPTARPEDLVLMLNRSAFGPTMPEWYSRYAEPFAQCPRLALCGSSINLEFKAHVQTYAWMARMGSLQELANDFPGAQARTRTEAIFNGEIGLSQRLIDNGYRITSLAWPGEVFDQSRRNDLSFPQVNISRRLKDTPFRHWEGEDRRKLRLYLPGYLRRLRSNLAA